MSHLGPKADLEGTTGSGAKRTVAKNWLFGFSCWICPFVDETLSNRFFDVVSRYVGALGDHRILLATREPRSGVPPNGALAGSSPDLESSARSDMLDKFKKIVK